MRNTWRWAAFGALIALTGGCAGTEAPAAEPEGGGLVVELPPIVPRTSLREVMVGLVDHAAQGIWDLERPELEPESDADWEEVMHYATQLVASGSYISWGGIGEMDANWVERTEWREFSEEMTEVGLRVYDAAIIHDLDGVLVAGDELAQVCDGCHQEFRIELPEEGVRHLQPN